jgi:hypothetical protein
MKEKNLEKITQELKAVQSNFMNVKKTYLTKNTLSEVLNVLIKNKITSYIFNNNSISITDNLGNNIEIKYKCLLN